MNLALIMQIVSFTSAILILFDSIGAVNRMSHRTDHLMRIAFVLIASGAFGELIAIFAGHEPSLPEVAFISGVGLMTICERRIFSCPVLKSTGVKQGDCQ